MVAEDVSAMRALIPVRATPANRPSLNVLFDIVRRLVKWPRAGRLVGAEAVLSPPGRLECGPAVCRRRDEQPREESAMKIVVLDGRPMGEERAAWAGLDRLGEVEVHEYSSPEEIRSRAEGAAVLVTNKAPISAEVIDGSPDLRFITLTATGYDCVDIAAARRRGIPVSNVPDIRHGFGGAVRVRAAAGALPSRRPARRGRPGRRVDQSARFLDPEDAADRAGRQDDGDRRLRPDRPARGRAGPGVRHAT